MNLFVDACALVKLYYPEPDSQRVEDLLLSADRLFISELSVVEFASALMKKVRLKELTETDKSLIWESFNNDLYAENVDIIELTTDDYYQASKFILDYANPLSLRTLDSLQVAAATKIEDADLLTTDTTLKSFARSLDIKTVDV